MDMTRRCFLAMAGTAALGLTACSKDLVKTDEAEKSPQENKKQVKNDQPLPVEIVESGYSIDENGYLKYGIALRNPNEDVEAQYVSFNVTAKDANGAILFTHKQSLLVIFPGDTVYDGFVAGQADSIATVEFTVGKSNFVKSTPIKQEEILKVSNVNEVPGGYGRVSFTGEVTAMTELNADTFNQVSVTVITRDADGKINYGDTTFCDLPANGQSVPFEIADYNVPEHSSFELHAKLW